MVVATPGRHCLDWFIGSGVPVCIGFGIYRFRYFGMRHTSGFVRDSVRARHWPVIVAVRMTASRSVCGFDRCILCVASFFFGRFGHVELFGFIFFGGGRPACGEMPRRGRGEGGFTRRVYLEGFILI